MTDKEKKQIPKHLQPYISTQYYHNYTPIDHSVWRFVMKQNHYFLKDIAHPAYVNGLRDSGIKIDQVPKVGDMDTSLAKIGWGAVTIDGLIPGSAFYGFLANRILPIATEIRNIQNIAYTPAPDMLHEAAGHAPILLDETYRDFVRKIGEMGAKALSSKEKLEVFKAVRHLTIIAEDPDSTPEQVQEAERQVVEARSRVKGLSEADKVSRLFWWTVEYGLIGDMNNPKIYGAGLLSSVGESQSCLKPDVKKIPFSVEECINTPYDVTKPQPQLFVCKSFDDLVEKIEQFASTMAFRKGGTESLDQALESNSVATMVLSSGLQVTGTLTAILKDENAEAIYVRTKGPTALSYDYKQLKDQGTDIHRKGFGTPIGKLKGGIVIEACTTKQLQALGIKEGTNVLLNFQSGVTVEGLVKNILFYDEKPILISFSNCQVTYKNIVLFEPSWGIFDMAVGARVTSVFAGAADPNHYYDSPSTNDESMEEVEQQCLTELENMYAEIRDLREGQWKQTNLMHVDRVLAILDQKYPNEWLLRIEILELYKINQDIHQNVSAILNKLKKTNWDPSIKQMIDRGITLIEQI
ncbi:aromatic amino acid hydroxylase [Neobacillus cucumis]|uniref:aromatic amino acid hydroxylase n=1 Tax=Neobacillus cucumis TaxID=1740721 RepID=UPI00203CC762|nr:aromatic amino acid hydroxylase [Neobacillus cucumis]MCM3726269.1 aromatic amino acid hydroxylase [Neobacillus cucumis]